MNHQLAGYAGALLERMLFLQILASLVLCILESILLLKAALMEAGADGSGPIELKGYRSLDLIVILGPWPKA